MKSLIRFILSKVFWINVLIMAVLSVALYFVLSNYLESYTHHGETKSIPYVVGYHETEVTPLLKDGKFQVVVNDSMYDPSLDGGMILDQFPDSGSVVKLGRKIYITISSYSTPMVTVPTVKGLTKRIAMAKLRSSGFIIDSLVYEPSTCTECVVALRYKGETLESNARIGKASHLDLVLGGGSGDQFVQVPALYGLYEEEVNATLLQLGLNVDLIIHDHASYEEDEDSLKTKLYRQIPAFKEGDRMRLGSAIKLFYSADYNKIPEISIDSTKLYNGEVE